MKKNFSLSAFLLLSQLLWSQIPNGWINEIHYDNAGTDVNELVEVILENPDAYNLNDFTLTLYNGSGGLPYGSFMIGQFSEGDRIGNFTLFVMNINGIQNGSPDGLSLDYRGTVIQFLSYEGTFLATGGPASGMVSTDIGVEETGSAPETGSLQLTGDGLAYSDFSWSPPSSATPGCFNNGQSIGGITLPAITVTPSVLAGFTYEIGFGPGPARSFSVRGSNLNGSIIIIPPADYEISGDGVFFQSASVALVPSGFTVEQTTVFVRLRAGLSLSDYNQEILLTSAGATDKTVNCTGLVIPVLPDLVINEIMADPGATNGDANGDGMISSSDDEFIEIVNNGSYAVNLSGFTLSDAIGVKHVFCSIILNPGEAIVVFGGGVPTGFSTYVLTASSGGLGLNNGGDEVTLKNPFSHVVDSYVYGPEGGNDQSLTRDPDLAGSFVLHSEAAGSAGTFYSPGLRNDGTPFTLPGPPVPVNGYYFLLAFAVIGLIKTIQIMRRLV